MIAPLFNIMVHDVDTAMKGKVVLTMYADDLAIWTDTHIRRLHTNSSYVKQSMKLFQTWSGVRDWMVLRWRRGRCIPIHLGSWNERTLRWTWKG